MFPGLFPGLFPRLFPGSFGSPGVLLSLERHSVLVPLPMVVGKEGQWAVLALGTVLRVPHTYPRVPQSPHLAPQEAVGPHGESLSRCPCPVPSHPGWNSSRGAPRAPRPLCLFLHYFPAPPTLSLPLLLCLAFVPSLLFPSLLPEAFPHLQSLLRLPSLCQLSIDPLFSISGQLS